MKRKVTVEDFLALHDFNLSAKQIEDITKHVAKKNFNYEILTGMLKDKIILETLMRIDSNLTKSGEKRKLEWNDGWGENLNEFISTNYSYSSLVPKYYRPGNIKRWRGNYIRTESDSFEYDFFDVLRHVVFQNYLASAHEVYEFGCGSPHNLVELFKLFPGIKLHGCDWSQSAVTICELLRKENGIDIKGHLFDFFNPKLVDSPTQGCTFITCGGLEQVGSNFKAYVNFVLSSVPEKVIHLEPICELYQGTESLLDYLAKSYHESRNYLNGYLTYLLNLEKEDLVEIEAIRRIPAGGHFHEGWSLIVWRPTAGGVRR